MKPKHIHVAGGLALAFLASALVAKGHSLLVDLDPITPGFQTAVAVTPGTIVTADIHLVSDGVTPLTGFALALNYNDTPGVLAPVTPTIAGPVAGAMAAPIDLGLGVATAPGAALAPLGVPVFGVGPGGPFTATDGGAGIYDFAGAPIPLPPLGGTIILESVMFAAVGPIGTMSDIAPLGVVVPGAPPGVAAPPVVAAGPGFEFYDAGGLGSYAALPFAPGANPAFPGGLPAVGPGTVAIIPEPGSLLLSLGGLGLLLRRRRS